MTEKQSQGVLNLVIEFFFLFPVVGNPFQAKYSGTYKVVKKISDTNYSAELLVDMIKHKCVIAICSKHIMKNQNQN